MNAAAPFDCAICGRRIGKAAGHYAVGPGPVTEDRVIWSKHLGCPRHLHARFHPGCPVDLARPARPPDDIRHPRRYALGDPLRLRDRRHPMTGTLGIRTAALPAWQSLQLSLLDLHRPVPCQSAPDVWTSDNPNRRAIAAAACGHCPVILQCATFARVNREASNVWAGVDRTPTRGRPAAQQKVRTA